MVLTAALAAVLALCADTAVASPLETAKSSALESRAFCAHPSARCSTTARGGGGLRTRRRYGGANVGGRRSVLASVSGGGFDWRYFAAGGLSAAISHGYTTPIDVVKTTMQAQPQRYANVSLSCAATKIVAERGPRFLLQGLAPTVLGYGFEGALKFGVYELLKPVFANLTPSTFVNFLLASIFAGAIAAIALCPAEAARIRLVACPHVPYTMAKQVSFDFITAALYAAAALAGGLLAADGSAGGGAGAAAAPPAAVVSLVPFAAAALASVLACAASHPGDMVLTRCYQAKGLGTADAFRQIYDAHGVGGFSIGIQARFLHVGAIITMQLVVYDMIKRMLGLPATGH